MKRIILAFLLALIFFNSPLSYGKDYGWGIVPNKDHVAPDPGPLYKELINKHNAYYIGDSKEKTIYLTFDTGYENGNTEKILNVLIDENVNACFFMTGHFLRENKDLVKRISDAGMVCGNHTWSHPKLTLLSKEKINDELIKVENLYSEITGKKMSKFVRPPEGMLSDQTLTYLDELGFTSVYWSLAFNDWHLDKQHGWEHSYNYVMDHIHNGAIILMHSVSQDNTDAIRKIIQDLKKDGYQFGSLENLCLI